MQVAVDLVQLLIDGHILINRLVDGFFHPRNVRLGRLNGGIGLCSYRAQKSLRPKAQVWAERLIFMGRLQTSA